MPPVVDDVYLQSTEASKSYDSGDHPMASLKGAGLTTGRINNLVPNNHSIGIGDFVPEPDCNRKHSHDTT